jgi:hypothetical protein
MKRGHLVIAFAQFLIFNCSQKKNIQENDKLIQENVIHYASELKREYKLDSINIIIESINKSDTIEVTYSMVKEISSQNIPFIYQCKEENGIIMSFISLQNSTVKPPTSNCVRFTDKFIGIRDYYPERIWIFEGKKIKNDIPDWTKIRWLQIPPPPNPNK